MQKSSGFIHTYTQETSCSSCSVEEIFQRAKELNAPAVVITDKQLLSSYVKAYELMMSTGVKAIVGVELPLNIGKHKGTIILIPRNMTAFWWISKLTAESYKREYISLWQMHKYFGESSEIHGKVIGVVGGPESIINASLKKDGTRYIEPIVKPLKEIFGDELFLEIQYHGLEAEKMQAKSMLGIVSRFKLGVVAGNGPLFPEKKDLDRHRYLMQARKKYSSSFQYDDFYMKDDSQLAAKLKEIFPAAFVSSAMSGVKTLINQCEAVSIPKRKYYPAYKKSDSKVLIEQLAIQKLEKLFENSIPSNYLQRLDYELQVVTKMGYADYIAITCDIVCYAKSLDPNSIGPGRGSAVGSLLCYLLDISFVDPVKHDLFFERFLNPYRITMPDIDIDISSSVRSQVLDYVSREYGSNAWCKLIVNNKLGEKNAGNLLPLNADVQIRNSLAEKFTQKSLHHVGFLLSDLNDISNRVPIMKLSDEWAAQLDKYDIAKIGLLKFDLIKLPTLDIISEVLEKLNMEGRQVSYESVLSGTPDSKVMSNIYSEGRTSFVFQFGSDGMKKILREFQPVTLDDLALLLSLYRPGPFAYIDEILRIRRSVEHQTIITPSIKAVFGETYGYPVYEEQMIEIFRKVLEIGPQEADLCRVQIKSGSDKKRIEDIKNKFIQSLIQEGAEKDEAEKFWQDLQSMNGYTFKKAHAVAYTYLSYMTAYLKYYYPQLFFCAVLNWTDNKKYGDAINESKLFGVKIIKPDINTSPYHFATSGQMIEYGLKGIRKFPAADARIIIREREQHGAFKSIKDFMYRCSLKSNSLKALVLSGAMDRWSENRTGMLETVLQIHSDLSEIKYCSKRNKFGDKGGSEFLLSRIDTYLLPCITETERKKNINYERDYLGNYLTDHFEKFDLQLRTGELTGIVLHVSEQSEGIRSILMGDRYTTKTLCNCTQHEFSKYRHLLCVGNVICYTDTDGNITGVRSPMPKKQLLIKLHSVIMWHKVHEVFAFYKTDTGHEAFVEDMITGQIWKVPYRISSSVRYIDSGAYRVEFTNSIYPE